MHMLTLDGSYIMHAQFTACRHVMMFPLSVEQELTKKQAVSDNNGCVSAPVCMRVRLDGIQTDLLRSSL